MQMVIKVSIIIPVYNVESYISKCLESVFCQSYKNIEVIVVDDRGTDSSMELVYSYKDKSPFEIKIITHENNKGLSAARNSGIKVATGDYIFFLDSDDTLPNDSILNLVNKVYEYQNVDFVIGEFNVLGREKSYNLKIEEYTNNKEDIFINYLQYKWFVMACNKLIKKDVIINNNIFFMNGFLHEDENFSFQLALKANSMAACNDYTYNYIIRTNSITQNKTIKNFKDQLIIIEKNLSSIEFRKLTKNEFNEISIYLINSIYSFIGSLINEGTFSDNNKKILKEQSINLYNKYKEYNHLNIKSLIKKIIIFTPFKLQKYFFQKLAQ